MCIYIIVILILMTIVLIIASRRGDHIHGPRADIQAGATAVYCTILYYARLD